MESHLSIKIGEGCSYFVKREKSIEIALEVVYGLATIESVYHYTMDNLTGTNIPDIIFVSRDEKKVRDYS